jgi:hypothetical protein
MAFEPEKYLIEEYKCLYTEILQRIQRIEEQLRWGLLACGGLWAWLLSNQTQPWFKYALPLPVVIAAFFSISWALQDWAIRQTGEYIKVLEKTFQLPDDTGWIRNGEKYHVPWLTRATTLFWVVFLLANIGLVCYFLFRDRP